MHIKAGTNGGVVNPTANKEEQTVIYRASVKPYKLGKQIDLNWTMAIGGAVSFISIACMVSFWQHPILFAPVFGFLPWVYIPMMSGLVLLLWSMVMNYSKTKHTWFGASLEVDKNRLLFKTRISGTCGMCGGDMRLAESVERRKRVHIVLCKKHPQYHRWVFDRTVLSDVGDDYHNRLKQ